MSKYWFTDSTGTQYPIDMSLLSEYFEEDSASNAWYIGIPRSIDSYNKWESTPYYYGPQNLIVRAVLKSIIKKIKFQRRYTGGSLSYISIKEIVLGITNNDNIGCSIIYYDGGTNQNYSSITQRDSYTITGQSISFDGYEMKALRESDSDTSYYWKIIIRLTISGQPTYDITLTGMTLASRNVFHLKSITTPAGEYNIGASYNYSVNPGYFYPYKNSENPNNLFWNIN